MLSYSCQRMWKGSINMEYVTSLNESWSLCFQGNKISRHKYTQIYDFIVFTNINRCLQPTIIVETSDELVPKQLRKNKPILIRNRSFPSAHRDCIFDKDQSNLMEAHMSQF